MPFCFHLNFTHSPNSLILYLLPSSPHAPSSSHVTLLLLLSSLLECSEQVYRLFLWKQPLIVTGGHHRGWIRTATKRVEIMKKKRFLRCLCVFLSHCVSEEVVGLGVAVRVVIHGLVSACSNSVCTLSLPTYAVNACMQEKEGQIQTWPHKMVMVRRFNAGCMTW